MRKIERKKKGWLVDDKRHGSWTNGGKGFSSYSHGKVVKVINSERDIYQYLYSIPHGHYSIDGEIGTFVWGEFRGIGYKPSK
jgi:hypothetical protein